jgi:hypothetical protein
VRGVPAGLGCSVGCSRGVMRSPWRLGDRLYGGESGRGSGHYLNSQIDVTGGVIKLIRTQRDSLNRASRGDGAAEYETD